MSDIQKWLVIAAVWVIAISLFMIGLGTRYAPHNGNNYPVVVDRWTGYLVTKGYADSSSSMGALGFEKLLKELKLSPTSVIPNETQNSSTEGQKAQ
jgi:hypothetical protein